MSVVKSTVAAAEADLAILNTQLETFEEKRFTKESSLSDIYAKFPGWEREIELGIKSRSYEVFRTKA